MYHRLVLACLLSLAYFDCFSQSEIHFRANQLGYARTAQKEILMFSEKPVSKKVYLLNGGDSSLVTPVSVKKANQNGWGRFKYYYNLHIPETVRNGTYYLAVKNGDFRSREIFIGEDVYQDLTSPLLEFMRQQRCGYNPFFDAVCHQADGRIFYGHRPDSTFVDASGGWHDAGDQLKYLITSSYASAHMLMAYEIFPEKFDDKVNELGQPFPNHVPDVLDEAKWGLLWILKLHFAEDQLIHQVADDRDHVGWKMPENDRSDYGWGKNSYRVAYVANGEPQGLREFKSEATGLSNLAGRSAAALALGARIWSESGDKVFSERCLKAAVSLYQLGRSMEGYQQGNSYGAPYRYTEETWADDMEWAAAELYKATGEKDYLDQAVHYSRIAKDISWMNLDTASHYQFYPFINLGHFSLYSIAGDDVKRELAGYYRKGIEYTYNRSKANPYGIGIPFLWCSNNLLTSLITQIILYERMTGDMEYHPFMISQFDWLFGRNPWGTTMFTGMPARGDYPEDIHTSTWALTRQMVPGGLVDGPVYNTIFSSLKGISLSEEDEFLHLQNEYVVYHDDIGDYSTNEPTMDGTAGSIMMMAYFQTDH